MQSYKISLGDLARRMSCSMDWLLALAEADQITLFARIEQYSAELKGRHGQPAFGTFRKTTGSPRYTVLLPNEVAALRAGKEIMLKMVRDEGAENGYSQLLQEHNEEYLYWFDEPQTININQVFINDDVQLPPDVVPADAPEPINTDAALREVAQAISKIPDAIKEVARSKPEPQQLKAEPLAPSTASQQRKTTTAPALEIESFIDESKLEAADQSPFPDAPQIDKDTPQPAPETKFLATIPQLTDAFGCSQDILEEYAGSGPSRKFIGYVKKYRFADRNASLALAVKVLEFPEKHEHSGPGGGHIPHTEVTPKEYEDALARQLARFRTSREDA